MQWEFFRQYEQGREAKLFEVVIFHVDSKNALKRFQLHETGSEYKNLQLLNLTQILKMQWKFCRQYEGGEEPKMSTF